MSTKDATTPATETQAEGDCETPPSISHEQFTKDYPNTSATVTINLGGQQLTCHFVNDKVFLGSSQKGRLPGIASSNAKPVFAYAGGQWLSDSSKDKFVTKNMWCFQSVCTHQLLLASDRQRIFFPSRRTRQRRLSSVWKDHLTR